MVYALKINHQLYFMFKQDFHLQSLERNLLSFDMLLCFSMGLWSSLAVPYPLQRL